MSRVDLKKKYIAMSHVSVTYFPPCHMSKFKNSHTCLMSLYFLPPRRMSRSLMSPVEFKKSPCRSVEFRGQGQFVWVLGRIVSSGYSYVYRTAWFRNHPLGALHAPPLTLTPLTPDPHPSPPTPTPPCPLL